jgi:alkylated DNA repair dioxygenase AlkB
MTEIPSGLSYFGGVLSNDDYNECLNWLENSTDWFPVGNSTNSRVVMHFGYTYDYKSGKSNKIAPPFNEIIIKLSEIASKKVNSKFNQCIINRYLPTQGISAHIDSLNYGPYIACFTIGSGAELEFTHENEIYKLYTEPNSLYIMSGESRYSWKHQMRGRKSDPNHGERKVRYSITFRSV